MRERRATVRVGCLLPARCHSPNGFTEYEGRIRDLSVRGLGLLGRSGGERGEQLTVSFTLPSEEQPLTVSGIIRWTAPGSSGNDWRPMGIEFTALDDTQHYRLQAFVTDQIQRSGRLGPLARTLGRLKQSIPARVMVVTWFLIGGLLAAGLCIWILALKRQNASLSQTLAERTIAVNQLETRHHALLTELGQAKALASSAAALVSRLQQQTAQLTTEVLWLAQNLGELKQAYLRVRDEREHLRQQLGVFEQQKASFEYRLRSIPELRKALRGAHQVRQQQLREERLRWIAALREADRRELETGNRGYVIQAGQPTLTSARLSIRVYTPEPTPSPFP